MMDCSGGSLSLSSICFFCTTSRALNKEMVGGSYLAHCSMLIRAQQSAARSGASKQGHACFGLPAAYGPCHSGCEQAGRLFGCLHDPCQNNAMSGRHGSGFAHSHSVPPNSPDESDAVLRKLNRAKSLSQDTKM